jgi:hypothetical protein
MPLSESLTPRRLLKRFRRKEEVPRPEKSRERIARARRTRGNFVVYYVVVNWVLTFCMKYCYIFGMKTAISLPNKIFEEVEKFSKEHQYSRSEVFAMAVKEFLEKKKTEEVLNVLNEVYSEAETPEEITVREKGKRYFARKILKEKR